MTTLDSIDLTRLSDNYTATSLTFNKAALTLPAESIENGPRTDVGIVSHANADRKLNERSRQNINRK